MCMEPAVRMHMHARCWALCQAHVVVRQIQAAVESARMQLRRGLRAAAALVCTLRPCGAVSSISRPARSSLSVQLGAELSQRSVAVRVGADGAAGPVGLGRADAALLQHHLDGHGRQRVRGHQPGDAAAAREEHEARVAAGLTDLHRRAACSPTPNTQPPTPNPHPHVRRWVRLPS